MSGEQFAPYEPPYMKLWRERLEAKPKPVKPAKDKRKKGRKKAHK